MASSIIFLSDFGYRNEWVGICHAVIDKIAPDANVIDLSHGVPPLDVQAGALVLSDSLPFIRHDSIVLAVVDPSVGRDRDIAVRTGDGRLLVGPANGLLAPASPPALARACPRRGGGGEPASPPSSGVLPQPVSPSLHARDVLPPAAAHLATGMSLNALGEALEPEALVELAIPEPSVEDGKIACEVLDLNRFANVQLTVRTPHLPPPRLPPPHPT